MTANAGKPLRIDCELCIVRDWRRDDRDSLVRYADNRSVWRNLADRFPHPYTAKDAKAWFTLLERMAEPTHWAIEVDGEAVGGIGVDLREGIYAKNARFGYWLGEPFWGQGIATAAVRAVAPFALANFDIVRLEAPVYEWNPASMRVLEKAGFVREAVHRRAVYKDGLVSDEILYALIR
jgi:ribosomal-protein-alanine N-acetyltransferase